MSTSKPLTLDRQFSISDSKHVEETDAWEMYRVDEPWEQEYMTVLVQGKGDAEGNDMVTKETLAKLELVLDLWFNLTVTTKTGRVFSIWDLCYRGPAIPDFPNPLSEQTQGKVNGPLYMPCLSISVLDCFSEQARFLHHDSYYQLDIDPAILKAVFGDAVKAYSLRPSYKNKTPQEIKAILMNSSINPVGCPWYTQNVTFPLFTSLLGHSEHSNGLLTRTPYLFTTQFYDGPQRMAFRKLGTTFPNEIHRSLEEEMTEFDEARRLHMDSFYESVIEFSKDSQDVGFFVLKPFDYEFATLVEQGGQAQWLEYFAIYALHFTISFAFLDCRSPLHSRCAALTAGVHIVLVSVFGSIGLYLLVGGRYNSIIVTTVAPLLLSIGIEDVLILAVGTLDFDPELLQDKTMTMMLEEIFARTFASISFISCTRILTFAAGMLVQIPIVADSCRFLCLWAVTHYLLMISTYSLYALVEAIRMKYAVPEPFCCCCNTGLFCTCCPERCPCSPEYKLKRFESGCTTLRLNAFRRLCLHSPVYIGISILGVILCVVSVMAISLAERAENPVVACTKRNSYTNEALHVFFNHFGNFQSYLVFWDVNVPMHQKEMLELYDAVTGVDGCGPWIFPNFLSSFYTTWGTGVDGFFNTSSWTHPAYAPFGIASTLENDFYLNYHSWNMPVLSNKTLFTNLTADATDATAYNSTCWAGLNDLAREVYTCENNSRIVRPFVFADLSNANEFSYYTTKLNETLPHWKLRLSFMKFWTQLATEGSEPAAYMDGIRDSQDILSKATSFQNSQVFLQGLPYTVGASTLQAKATLYRQVFPLDLCAIIVITGITFCSIAYSLLLSWVVVMTVLETCGIVACFLPFSIFSVMFQIMAAGVAVNSVGYYISVFSRSKLENWDDRVITSLATSLPVLAVSSAALFSSCVVLAFDPLQYTFTNFCIPLGLMMVVQMFNGCIMLPSLLMTLNRLPCFSMMKGREVTV